MALDEPLLVVELRPLEQRDPQVLDGLEGTNPQQLLLQRADSTLDAAVALGRTHEGRARLDSQETNLALKVRADVLRPVVVTQLQTSGDLRADRAEYTSYRLAHRLQGLPARRTLGGVDAQDLCGVMVDGQHDAHAAVLGGPGAG